MVPQIVETLWYQALFEENCLRVKELLKDHKELLKVGWKSDTNLAVKGSPDNHWTPRKESPWKGRTALHVGARRGDVELVQQVLILCDMTDVTLLASRTAAVAYKGFFSKETTRLGVRCEECKMDPITGPRFRFFRGDVRSFCLECSGKYGADFVDVYPLAGRKPADQRPILTSDSAGKNCYTADADDDADDDAAESSNANSTPRDSLSSSEVEEDRRKTTPPSHSKVSFVTPVEQSAQGMSDGADRTGKDTAGASHDGTALAVGDQIMKNYEASIAYMSKTRSGRMIRHGVAGLSDYLVSKSELRKLLLSKDGQYELDALAMAMLHGNVDIITLLVYALGECDDPPYSIDKSEKYTPQACIDENDSKQRIELTNLTMEVIDRFQKNQPAFMAACENEYREHRDFNFLPLEEYLFHFSWTSRFEEKFHEVHKDLFRMELWREFKQHDNELWCFVLKLHDGQGRTPMHVAAGEGTVKSCLSVLQDNVWVEILSEAADCALNALDGSGRLPIHRAAAMGASQSWGPYLSTDMKRKNDEHRGQINAAFSEARQHPISKALEARQISSFSLSTLSAANGFRAENYYGSTPLQAAIIHNSFAYGAWLLRHKRLFEEREMLYRYGESNYADIVELVCVVGADADWVRYLFVDGHIQPSMAREPSRSIKGWNKGRKEIRKHLGPILHLVATFGNYEALKLFIDNSFDPFVEDEGESTALHCVMRDRVHYESGRPFEFSTHLLDYVSCEQLLMKDKRNVKKIVDDNILADKKGCVNLLLQAGCDIFKTDKKKQVPYPQDRLISSATFLSWWYDKQAKEFADIQSSLNNAANAISVTATLVATASFVGPLQPPRGYTQDNQMEYENGWVATFVFCDTLSFYLAIVALIFSLIPCLPVPQQPMFQEL